MKKLLFIALLAPAASFAQAGTDTLIWEDFNTDPATFLQIGSPPNVTWDTAWYDVDNDGLADGSGSGRPDEWFWNVAFADTDTVNNPGVLMSNSWTNDGNNHVDNWLILPSIYIADTTADLFWKAAPRQTPRYLDGYMVLVSTTTNDFTAFTDTLFVASEYTSLDVPAAPSQYSSYTFTPANGFIHGMDGTFTEFDPSSDSSRLVGRLRPFTVDLSAYAGQNIFIAFEHYTIDDNLLEVDDIFVEGTGTTGIHEMQGSFPMSAYPNPANDVLHINYSLNAASDVTLNIMSIDGQVVRSESLGMQQTGSNSETVDISGLSAGVYFVTLQTDNGITSRKIVVE